MDFLPPIDVGKDGATRVRILKHYMTSVWKLYLWMIEEGSLRHLGAFRSLPFAINEPFGFAVDENRTIFLQEIEAHLLALTREAEVLKDIDGTLVSRWRRFYNHVVAKYTVTTKHVVPKLMFLDFRLRSGFGRNPNKGNGNGNGNNNNNNNQPKSNGSASSSPTGYSPSTPLAHSPYSQSSTMGSESGSIDAQLEPEGPKFFFREKFAKLGVRGNFMPLAAQPKNVDLGDWLAHQAHEQYRVLVKVISCIQEVDAKTGQALCNPQSCPVMSAGRAHIYTWLNNKKEPVKVPAPQYFYMVQTWLVGKLTEKSVFPTDTLSSAPTEYPSVTTLNTPGANTPIAMGPTTLTTPLPTLAGHDWVGKSTGFPETFFHDCKLIFRQMFRLYAHTYHSHWIDPFWHLQGNGSSPSSGWTDLNSCFVHFITVAKLYGLLSDRDMEPMQPLIDIWVANGAIPADAASGACAIVPFAQQGMLQAEH